MRFGDGECNLFPSIDTNATVSEAGCRIQMRQLT